MILPARDPALGYSSAAQRSRRRSAITLGRPQPSAYSVSLFSPVTAISHSQGPCRAAEGTRWSFFLLHMLSLRRGPALDRPSASVRFFFVSPRREPSTSVTKKEAHPISTPQRPRQRVRQIQSFPPLRFGPRCPSSVRLHRRVASSSVRGGSGRRVRSRGLDLRSGSFFLPPVARVRVDELSRLSVRHDTGGTTPTLYFPAWSPVCRGASIATPTDR